MTGPSTRFLASVMLQCGGRLLMMRRSDRKELAPGKWSIAGGHFEPGEQRAPARAALRELYEETGIEPSSLHGFGLRYVLMTAGGGELRVHFQYAARLDSQIEPAQTDEGTFRWIERENALALDLSDSVRATLSHFLRHPEDSVVRFAFRQGSEARWLATDAAPDAGFRPAAGTIARHGSRLLLLHRPMNKEIAPGMWANIGGHMEGDELRDPSATALREFGEETGLAPGALRGLAFSSAMLIAKPHEFGLLIGYRAQMEGEAAIPDSEEDGAFRWVDEGDVPSLPMTPAMKAVALIDARREGPKLGLVRGGDVRLFEMPT